MPYGSVNADKMTTSDGVSSSGLYGFKNRIINGAMVIDQRNAGASISGNNNVYSLDRWKIETSQNSKFTVQQTPSATETGYATRVGAGFTNYLACTSSAATTVGAGDYYQVEQLIEGFNTADLAWGTSNAKTVTLSFWAYSSLTGTFGGYLGNSAFNRLYPFTYTISSANTWTQISVTITGDTSGTWIGATSGIGMYVGFILGIGSTYGGGTANAWNTTKWGATGITNVVATNGATFYITGVQLEKGSTATSFDYRPFSTELTLCQRYYENTYDLGTAVGSGSVNSMARTTLGIFNGNNYGNFLFKVPKRANPTIVFYDNNGTSGNLSGYTTTTAVSVAASVFGAIITELAAGSDSVSVSASTFGANIAELATGSDSVTVAASTFNAAIAETATALDAVYGYALFICVVSESATAIDVATARLLWEIINDSQNAGWQTLNTAQSTTWSIINDSVPNTWSDIPTLD